MHNTTWAGAALMAVSLAACESVPMPGGTDASGNPTGVGAERLSSIAIGPEPVSSSQPEYPRLAIFRSIEAECAVTFDLNDDGEPKNICSRCETTTGRMRPDFELAARQAVRDWRYPPAGHPDSPPSRWGVITGLTFYLDEDAPPDIPNPYRPYCE